MNNLILKNSRKLLTIVAANKNSLFESVNVEFGKSKKINLSVTFFFAGASSENRSIYCYDWHSNEQIEKTIEEIKHALNAESLEQFCDITGCKLELAA